MAVTVCRKACKLEKLAELANNFLLGLCQLKAVLTTGRRGFHPRNLCGVSKLCPSFAN